MLGATPRTAFASTESVDHEMHHFDNNSWTDVEEEGKTIAAKKNTEERQEIVDYCLVVLTIVAAVLSGHLFHMFFLGMLNFIVENMKKIKQRKFSKTIHKKKYI